MSYDVCVFDPAVAPRSRADFKEWYHRQAAWTEGHEYNDPSVTTPGLQEWYNDMRKHYPAMNGPNAVDPASAAFDHAADYSIARHFIYATFRWSDAEVVYPLFRDLAVERGVGFYDVSGDEGNGEIHFPGDRLTPPSGGAWRQVAKQFKESSKQ